MRKKDTSKMDRLRKLRPDWFEEHDNPGWGEEVVSPMRFSRWFLTFDMDGELPCYRVYETLLGPWDDPGDGKIELVTTWTSYEHAWYETLLMARSIGLVKESPRRSASIKTETAA